jgi:hypothetical protein
VEHGRRLADAATITPWPPDLATGIADRFSRLKSGSVTRSSSVQRLHGREQPRTSASHSTVTATAWPSPDSDVAAGTVQAVVVWDLDRLHRQLIELEQFMTLADWWPFARRNV